MEEGEPTWTWLLTVNRVRVAILVERTEAVDWEMPGALAGLLGSPSMHFSLHKASTPAPCAPALLFTRAEMPKENIYT